MKMSSQGKIDEMLNRIRQPNGLSPPSSSPEIGSSPNPNRRNLLLTLGDTNNDIKKTFTPRPNALKFSTKNNQNNLDTDRKLKEIMMISGKLNITNIKYKSEMKDLERLDDLGHGTCGYVYKMRHKPSNEIIAVKQMTRSGNSEENKRIIMDIEVVLKSHDCKFIVQCLGCFITDSEVWICMELMSTCFDKLLKKLQKPIPERILGKVTVATVEALSYLKDKHTVMHRDVKPSNILLDRKGNVKLCDFGISGRLVDSMAKTRSAGCAAYMAPERIEPNPDSPDYDVRADVWSLGITLVELATGVFPYQDCKTDFEVLAKVINQDPPSLPKNQGFSQEFQEFVSCCLMKQHQHRPKYRDLKKSAFIKKYEVEEVDVAEWYKEADPEVEEPANRQTVTTSTFRRFFSSSNNEPKPNTNGYMALQRPKIEMLSSSPPVVAKSVHTSRLGAFLSMTNGQSKERNNAPVIEPNATFKSYVAPKLEPYVPLPHQSIVQENIIKFNSPILQRRFCDSPNVSPYPQKRGVSENRWRSPCSSPLPLRANTEQHKVNNTSPIVLQRFYHQQKQQQMAKEAADEDAAKLNVGKKRFTSYIKLQLSGDRSGRSSRHQSPEPPPRPNRMNSCESPLSVRKNFELNTTTSPSLSKRYVSPTPPIPPPRRLSESSSVPGSPQQLRTRFQYTPEPTRRFFS